MPDVPKKMEIILEEKMPKTKLTATEIEFSDNTFSKVFCFKIFNLEISYHSCRISGGYYILGDAFGYNGTISNYGILANSYAF